MAVIEIVEGVYKIRGEDTSVAGRRFELVEQYRAGTDGVGYVTVNGASCPGFPERKIRIRCQGPRSYTVVEGSLPVSYEPVKSSEPEGVMSLVQTKVPDAVIAHESDETIIERTRQRFEVLKDMTKAVKEGTVRAMIVTGPPGVGKSFGVEEVLVPAEKDLVMDVLIKSLSLSH